MTFKDSERAVSPVIGVILMVAITVILAAVIGTFVLGLGDSLDDGTPQASFSISDTDADEELIEVRKTGGADIELNDIRVLVDVERNSSIETSEFDLANLESPNGDDWRSGDRARINVTSTDNTLNLRGVEMAAAASNINDLETDDEVTVTIVHKPSGGTIAERSVTV